MVDLRIGALLCTMVAFSPLAFAGDVVNFPGAGTVKLKNGGVGRVVGATALDSRSRTVSAVIDAKDRFGNNVRVTRALKAIPSAVMSFGKSCLSPRGAVVCAASAAIASYAAYEGYNLIDDWLQKEIVYDAGACVRRGVEHPEDPKLTVFGPTFIPCVYARRSREVIIHSEGHSLVLDDWSTYKTELGDRWVADTAPARKAFLVEYVRHLNSAPNLDMPADSLTAMGEEQFASMVFQDPEMLQIEPGLYPDIWEPISINEANPNPGEGTNPNPDTNPKPEDMIDMTQVPEEIVDLGSYFDWGSGWLPKSCPAPMSFPVMGDTFTFEYDVLCSSISTYVAPMMRFVAVMIFLNILIAGGARD